MALSAAPGRGSTRSARPATMAVPEVAKKPRVDGLNLGVRPGCGRRSALRNQHRADRTIVRCQRHGRDARHAHQILPDRPPIGRP